MTLTQILAGQILDPFRIALIIGLVITMLRTRATTGTVVPLAAGIVFVAAMLPMTMGRADGVPTSTAIGLGLVSNTILLGIVLGAWGVWQKLRRR